MTDHARAALCALLLAISALQLARSLERSYVPHRGTASARTTPRLTPELHKLRDGTAIDLNRATAAELEVLPGVGPALAARIVETRTARGGFKGIEELRAVRGVGEKTWARLAPLVVVAAPAQN